jgi:hypothetical protein
MENRFKCIEDYYYEVGRRTFTKDKIYPSSEIDSDGDSRLIDDDGDNWSFSSEDMKTYFRNIKFQYGK